MCNLNSSLFIMCNLNVTDVGCTATFTCYRLHSKLIQCFPNKGTGLSKGSPHKSEGKKLSSDTEICFCGKGISLIFMKYWFIRTIAETFRREMWQDDVWKATTQTQLLRDYKISQVRTDENFATIQEQSCIFWRQHTSRTWLVVVRIVTFMRGPASCKAQVKCIDALDHTITE